MKRTTDLQQEKAAALKTLRSAIRLKYSLMADRELAEKLPELEERINLAWASQTPLELSIGRLLEEV